jgi:flavin-dependent dehydrogenase
MYDVIVVGARCAGASLGMLLARRGLRVLLVDKAKFPSDTLSTHTIHESGIARLRGWDTGLLAAIRGSGCPAIASSITDVGPFSYVASHPSVDGNDEAFCPRRIVLDDILVKAAVAAGCELRTAFRFEDVLRDDKRVVGIRGRSATGSAIEERATLVVGADGRKSRVARAVGAATYDSKPTTTCTYYSYWADTAIDKTIIVPREGLAVIAVPTNDRLVVITAIFPIAQFDLVKADVEGNYLRALRASEVVMARFASARRAERFFGTADLPFHYRDAFGDGWALVGDAGHHKDPILARGITDAFRDAEGLADAVASGLACGTTLQASLRAWSLDRDSATRDLYEFTYRLSLLRKPSPQMERVYEAARTNAAVASRFHGVISGAVPYRDFFVSTDAEEIVRANSASG